MSGALNSVFGGGGIFGLLMNVASMAFPPLAIASSLTNLLTQTLGAALKGGIDILVKELGMPKFLGEMAKGIIDTVIKGNQKPSDAATDRFVGDKAGDQVTNWGKEFQKTFVDGVMEKVKKGGSDKPQNGEKVAAGSWLEAIALAMADAMSAKAGKMIELSGQIKTLSSEKIDPKNEDALKKNAGELNAANASLGAAGKEYELLTNTMKNVIDSIGNAMAQAARKS